MPFEKDLYFYHPDHLGSSSYVTDLNGKLYEHLEYFPFGEAWVEENSNQQRTPYLFTAKELDEETGLYYFGARYYDPRTSVWQSADPALGKFLPGEAGTEPISLPGMGGIYNPFNLGLYTYGHQNPVRYFDPDGKATAAYVLLGVALLYVAANYRPTPIPGKKPDTSGGLTDGMGSNSASGKLKNWIFNESNEGKKDEADSKEAPKAGDEGGKACPNPDGCKGKEDHRDKVGELSDKARAEAKEGEQVLENKQIRGHDSKRKPDVQIVDKEGRTRQIYEAERRPNSARNRAREAEYDRLGVPHETHPLN